MLLVFSSLYVVSFIILLVSPLLAFVFTICIYAGTLAIYTMLLSMVDIKSVIDVDIEKLVIISEFRKKQEIEHEEWIKTIYRNIENKEKTDG